MNAPTLDRRGFLQSAAGGLLVGFQLTRGAKRGRAVETAGSDTRINAWVHVAADNLVTLFIHKAEMGQGTVTSLSMLLAEELECDWTKIRTEFPVIDRAFGNQGVVGSASIRTSWNSLRQAGESGNGELHRARAYLQIHEADEGDIHWRFIDAVMTSGAQLAIFPLQDVLGLGTEARMNVPGRADGNWRWRMRANAFSGETIARLGELTGLSGR